MTQILHRFDRSVLLLTPSSKRAIPAKEKYTEFWAAGRSKPQLFCCAFARADLQPSGDTPGLVASKGRNVTELPFTTLWSKSRHPASPQSRDIMVFQGISASASSQRSLTDKLVLNTPNYAPKQLYPCHDPQLCQKHSSKKKKKILWASFSIYTETRVLHFCPLHSLLLKYRGQKKKSCKVNPPCICSLKYGQPPWEFYLEQKDCWRISHSLGGRRGHCFMETRKALGSRWF